MRNFTIGSLAVLFAALAGTATAGDKSSPSQSADPTTVINPILSAGKAKCADGQRSYAVGMTACIDQSINKCTQVVNPKNPNDTFIGWVDQHIKCTP